MKKQETETRMLFKLWKKTRRELNAARREICEAKSNVSTPQQYATERGWKCYTEDI